MHRLRHHLFPHAGWPDDKRIRFGGTKGADQAAEVDHGGAAARKPRLKVVTLARHGAEAAIFYHQCPALQRTAQGGGETLRGEGLFDEVIGPPPHRFDGKADLGMAGDQDDGEIAVRERQAFQKGHSVHAGHSDVRDHGAGEARPDQQQGGRGAGEGLDSEVRQFQRLFGRPAHRLVVVDEKDGLFHSAASAPARTGRRTRVKTAPPSGWLATRRSPSKSFMML